MCRTQWRIILVVTLCIMGGAKQASAQTSPSYAPEQLTGMLDDYRNVYRLEKAYLHTDKPYYVPGETIWFATYLRDAYSLTQSQLSKVLYVDLIDPDGKIVQSLTLYMDSAYSHGHFDLELDVLTGTYRLRAYTSWLRNYGADYYFDAKIQVYPLATPAKASASPNVASAITEPNSPHSAHPAYDLQFFPEGGALVEGIEARVGVKIVAATGYGEEHVCVLYDSLGTELTRCKTNERGMGSFVLTPQNAGGYYAQVLSEPDSGKSRPYFLPKMLQHGACLRVQNHQDKTAAVQITYSSSAWNQGGKLLIVSRSQTIGMVPIKAGKPSVELTIPLESVRDGIVRFTLFDHFNRPVAERMVFVYHQPDLGITLDQPTYYTREEVKLKLALSDQNGTPLTGKASIAVVDNQLVEVQSKEQNILSELLIDQELKGYIETPAWYFWNYDGAKRDALDLLMLIQGWRNYQWIDGLTVFPDRLRFIPESGITISGATSRLHDEDKSLKTQVTMVSTEGPFQYGEVITTDEGAFTFTGMVFFDSVNLVFQAYKYHEKRQKATGNRNVTLSLFEQTPPAFTPDRQDKKDQNVPPQTLSAYVLEGKKIQQIKRTFDPLSFVLDTVAITAGSLDTYEAGAEVSSDVLYRVNLDSMPGGAIGSIWEYLNVDLETQQILNGFGGESFVELDAEGNQMIEDFNDFLPVWLDGFQLTEQDARSMPISMIGQIEVLISADVASTVGAENGTIMLYSKTGSSGVGQVVRGIDGIKHPGFFVAKTFYEPRYEPENMASTRPDRRVTLHWEPVIQFGSDGQTELSFFTDDKETSYTLQIEGISDDGRPFFQTINFANQPK